MPTSPKKFIELLQPLLRETSEEIKKEKSESSPTEELRQLESRITVLKDQSIETRNQLIDQHITNTEIALTTMRDIYRSLVKEDVFVRDEKKIDDLNFSPIEPYHSILSELENELHPTCEERCCGDSDDEDVIGPCVCGVIIGGLAGGCCGFFGWLITNNIALWMIESVTAGPAAVIGGGIGLCGARSHGLEEYKKRTQVIRDHASLFRQAYNNAFPPSPFSPEQHNQLLDYDREINQLQTRANQLREALKAPEKEIMKDEPRNSPRLNR